MHIGFLLGDLALVYERLNIRVVNGAVNQLAALEMVDTGITSVYPVAISRWIDEKRCHGAVGLLLGRYRCQLDDDMRFIDNLLEQRKRIVPTR